MWRSSEVKKEEEKKNPVLHAILSSHGTHSFVSVRSHGDRDTRDAVDSLCIVVIAYRPYRVTPECLRSQLGTAATTREREGEKERRFGLAVKR